METVAPDVKLHGSAGWRRPANGRRAKSKAGRVLGAPNLNQRRPREARYRHTRQNVRNGHRVALRSQRAVWRGPYDRSGDRRLTGERPESIPDWRFERVAQLVAYGPSLDIEQRVVTEPTQDESCPSDRRGRPGR